MATKKLSVTLPVELAEDVERLAREQGLPLSSWLAEAAREARRHQAALAAIADYEAEFGRFTDAELAEARARLVHMDAVTAGNKPRRSDRNVA